MFDEVFVKMDFSTSHMGFSLHLFLKLRRRKAGEVLEAMHFSLACGASCQFLVRGAHLLTFRIKEGFPLVWSFSSWFLKGISISNMQRERKILFTFQ